MKSHFENISHSKCVTNIYEFLDMTLNNQIRSQLPWKDLHPAPNIFFLCAMFGFFLSIFLTMPRRRKANAAVCVACYIAQPLQPLSLCCPLSPPLSFPGACFVLLNYMGNPANPTAPRNLSPLSYLMTPHNHAPYCLFLLPLGWLAMKKAGKIKGIDFECNEQSK